MSFVYDDRTLAHEQHCREHPEIGTWARRQFTLKAALIAETTIAAICALLRIVL